MKPTNGVQHERRSGDGVAGPPGQATLHYSRHAARRVEARAIPPLVVELLVRYGQATRRHGAWRYALDKSSRRRLKTAIGKAAYARLEDLLDAYVVVSDENEVVTAAWRLDGRRKRCVRDAARLH